MGICMQGWKHYEVHPDHITVGRSQSIAGPYLARDGARMLDGGGTLAAATAGAGRAAGQRAEGHDHEEATPDKGARSFR